MYAMVMITQAGARRTLTATRIRTAPTAGSSPDVTARTAATAGSSPAVTARTATIAGSSPAAATTHSCAVLTAVLRCARARRCVALVLVGVHAARSQVSALIQVRRARARRCSSSLALTSVRLTL